MFFKTIIGLVAVTMIATALALGATTSQDEKMNSDPISGEWEVSFFVQGTTTPATFKLKLDGNKVTGTAESAHTGPGTLRDGSWADNKLSFTIDFAKHESIAITGHLDHDKLIGEFSTEGFTAKWEAKKKGAAAKPEAAAGASASGSTAGAINGEWEGTFTAEGTTVPLTLNFKTDGDKITGTTDSPHFGPGKITNGALTATGLSFDIAAAVGTINVKATLNDNKLTGEFTMGPRKGPFQAVKK